MTDKLKNAMLDAGVPAQLIDSQMGREAVHRLTEEIQKEFTLESEVHIIMSLICIAEAHRTIDRALGKMGDALTDVLGNYTALALVNAHPDRKRIEELLQAADRFGARIPVLVEPVIELENMKLQGRKTN